MNMQTTCIRFIMIIIFYFMLLLSPYLCIAGQTGHTNNIDTRGRIVDENDKPVMGATVTVKGTRNATATDDNGEFVLTGVDENVVLVISGVNIESLEVNVNGRTDLGVLKTKIKIGTGEEVVVEVNTGYQKLKPNEMNGSVVVIDNKTLNQQVGTNILDRLNHITSGLQFNVGKNNRNPQNNTNISIRGLSTISGPLDPLIVLDGFIYEGDINNINPNDVESITVLKDASAASIWGARAGNGVIVITSKKGHFNRSLQISANANVIVSSKPELFSLHPISTSDYVDMEEYLFNQGYFDGQINYAPYMALTPGVQILLDRRNGVITSSDSAKQMDALKQIDSRNDYAKYVYTNAVTQQYSLNLSGGSNNDSYFASISYDNSLTDLHALYKKVNIKVENTYRPMKKVQIGLSAYFTQNTSRTGMQGYNNSLSTVNGRYIPYFNLADNMGNPLAFPRKYKDAYIDSIGNGKLLDWNYYPLDDYKHSGTSVNLQELYAIASLNYKLSHSLNVDLRYQYQLQQSTSEYLADIQSFAARDMINSFTQIDPTTGDINYIIPPGGIRTLSNTGTGSSTLRGQVNFENTWRKHYVSAIAGSEIRQVTASENTFTAYGYNKDPLVTSAVDFVNYYPDLITGYYNSIGGSPYFFNTLYRFVSFYGNALYRFKGRYSLSASARKDGSNIFGANTNDKWKPLWSAGAGWKISDENFYSSALFPELQLKVSYGYSGNVDLSKTALPVGMYFTAPGPDYYPATRILTINNPDLKWEQSRQINIGVTFSTKKNIITGSIEYYLKNGSDLYGQTPYDYTTWGTTQNIVKNVAAMKGRGVDVTIHSMDLNRRIKWSTDWLFNYNRSKTTAYYSDASKNGASLLGGGNTIVPVIGKPLYGIVAYKWGGLDGEGNPQGYLDGKLSTDYRAIANEANTKGLSGSNLIYIGSGTPLFFGSLINRFTWKQLSVSINISYRLNYYFQKPALRYTGLVGGGIVSSDYEKRWKQPGDEQTTNIPSFQYPVNNSRDDFYSLSEVNVLRADNIKLEYIHLSYRINNSKSKNKTLSNLEIYANATNIGIIWEKNKEGLDSDYPNSLPPNHSLAFGLKCNF